MAKKKITQLDVMAAMEQGESCPDCDAEWQPMTNEKGKVIKDGGLTLVHKDGCVAYQAATVVGGNDE